MADSKWRKLDWVLRLAVAVILGQTLWFKFSAAPESVYIFSTLGLEPWGRIGAGIGELIAAILLLWPSKAWLGAILALGVISGALGAHLTKLGIEVQGDKGELFALACIVFAFSLIILWSHRREIPVIGKRF